MIPVARMMAPGCDIREDRYATLARPRTQVFDLPILYVKVHSF